MFRKSYSLFPLIFLFLFPIFSSKATCTLTARCTGGNWSAASTWIPSGCAGVTVPSDNCIIIVPACAIVDVDINSSVYANMEIYVYGQLNFDVGQKINMCPGYIKVFPGGQLGGSNPGAKINICGTTVWDGGGNTSGPVEFGGGTTLPVELTFFNAALQNGKVQLSWQTASETNNDHFTIERSLNAIDFEPVLLLAGAGTSTSSINYSAFDAQPFEGMSYYRLKQTDYDGRSAYSAILPVNYEFGGDFIIYPNPALQGDDITLNPHIPPGQKVLVILKDLTGREYYSKVIIIHSGDQLIAIDPARTIAPGTYFVVVSSMDKIYSKKLIVN
jgi:hypothetical protein